MIDQHLLLRSVQCGDKFGRSGYYGFWTCPWVKKIVTANMMEFPNFSEVLLGQNDVFSLVFVSTTQNQASSLFVHKVSGSMTKTSLLCFLRENLSRNIIQYINGTPRVFKSRNGSVRYMQHGVLWRSWRTALFSNKVFCYSLTPVIGLKAGKPLGWQVWSRVMATMIFKPYPFQLSPPKVYIRSSIQ